MKHYSKEFRYLWKMWRPRIKNGIRVKRKKPQAWVKWQLLDAKTQTFILSTIKQQVINEGDCPRDLVTWINQEGWEDLEVSPTYVPALPDELTKDVGHPEALKKVDTNMQRTINLRKLNAPATKRKEA